MGKKFPSSLVPFGKQKTTRTALVAFESSVRVDLIPDVQHTVAKLSDIAECVMHETVHYLIVRLQFSAYTYRVSKIGKIHIFCT